MPVAADLPAAEPYRRLLAGDWLAAAQAWEARGFGYQRALALAVGDETAKREALRLLDGLGASAAADRLRRELRRQGAVGVPRGPSRTTTANPAGLTARQLDVLAALVAGNSTAQIGDALSLSARTVEHHLGAIYAKLAVVGRTEAVAEAHARGLTAGKGRN